MITGILRYQIDFQVLSGQVFDELEDDFDLDDYWIGNPSTRTKIHNSLLAHSKGAWWEIGRGSVNVILLITLGCQLLTLPFADGKKQSSVISQLRNFTVFISGLSYGFKLYKVPIVNAVFLQQCFKLLYVY